MPDDLPLTSAEVSALYTRYGFLLRRRCRLLLRNDALADDAVQEGFLKMLKSGGPVRTMDEPLGWLYRVFDRTSFDLMRKAKVRAQVGNYSDDVGVAPGIDNDARDAALRLLADLSDEEQQIAVLAFVDGMTQGEIAETLGLSRVTINKKVQAIRERASLTRGGES